MEWNTYSIESHLSQFHETNSLQRIHEDVAVKYPPHPLQGCLLYIPSSWVTYCIKAAKRMVVCPPKGFTGKTDKIRLL